ncbi:hypothetical protein ACWDUL_17065 [Nocardia niigatensis]
MLTDPAGSPLASRFQSAARGRGDGGGVRTPAVVGVAAPLGAGLVVAMTLVTDLAIGAVDPERPIRATAGLPSIPGASWSSRCAAELLTFPTRPLMVEKLAKLIDGEKSRRPNRFRGVVIAGDQGGH